MGGSWNIFQSSIIHEPQIRKKSTKSAEGTQEEDTEISKKSKKFDVEVKEMPQKMIFKRKKMQQKSPKKNYER